MYYPLVYIPNVPNYLRKYNLIDRRYIFTLYQ